MTRDGKNRCTGWLAATAAFGLFATIASAQQGTVLRSPQAAHIVNLAGGNGGSVITDTCAYTQTTDGTGNGFASQDFEAAYDAFDCFEWDDFTLGAPVTVTGFHADGLYYNGAGPAVGARFVVATAPCFGGATLIDTGVIVPGGLASGDFDAPGSVPSILLGVGTYWIGIQARMDFSAGGQWGWEQSASPHVNGAAALFDNPGGGFGVAPCSVLPGLDYDLAFCVYEAGGGGPVCPGALVEQANDLTGNAQASQDFEAAFDAYDCSTYDDFVILPTTRWDITGFHAEGIYSIGPAASVNFSIYATDPCNPTVPICTPSIYTVNVPGPVADPGGTGTFDYAPGGTLVTLCEGTYWLAVQAQMDFGTAGQWFWSTSSVPHTQNNSAVFDNPGGGFGTAPCSVLTDEDQAFCILGAIGPVCPEIACRAGNVDTRGGNPAQNVMTVDGSTGDPSSRVYLKCGGGLVTVTVKRPPTATTDAHWGVWIYDGEPNAGTLTELFKKTKDIGLGCLCLPVNNSVVAGSCPCPLTFPAGHTSKGGLNGAKQAAFCLNYVTNPVLAKASVAGVSFTETLPAGQTFTVGGLIFNNNGSVNPAVPYAIMNWIIVKT